MENEIAKARSELELRLVTVKRGLLNELRSEYESAIKQAPPSLLKLPVMALRRPRKTRENTRQALPKDTGLAGIVDCTRPRPGAARKSNFLSISGKKLIREASIIGQSMILEDEDVPGEERGKGRAQKPSFAISIKDNSILIDRVDINSKDPDVVGNIIKDIQKVLKRHYKL